MGLSYENFYETGVDALDTWYSNRKEDKRTHEKMDYDSNAFATRYQTQVKDLTAAGLNPMLAYHQSPGSAPTATAMPVKKAGLAGTGISASLASAQEAKLAQEVRTGQAQEENIRNDTWVQQGLPPKIAAETSAILKSAELTETQIKVNTEMLPKIREEIKNLEKEGKQIDKITQLKQQEIEIGKQTEILVGQQAQKSQSEKEILEPKRKAAHRWSSEAGENAQHLWKIINPFHGLFNK